MYRCRAGQPSDEPAEPCVEVLMAEFFLVELTVGSSLAVMTALRPNPELWLSEVYLICMVYVSCFIVCGSRSTCHSFVNESRYSCVMHDDGDEWQKEKYITTCLAVVTHTYRPGYVTMDFFHSISCIIYCILLFIFTVSCCNLLYHLHYTVGNSLHLISVMFHLVERYCISLLSFVERNLCRTSIVFLDVFPLPFVLPWKRRKAGV